MDKKLREQVEKKFRSVLRPLNEYELIIRDDVGYPRRLDVLRETVNLSDFGSWKKKSDVLRVQL